MNRKLPDTEHLETMGVKHGAPKCSQMSDTHNTQLRFEYFLEKMHL